MGEATGLRTRLACGILCLMCFNVNGSPELGEVSLAQNGLPLQSSTHATDPNLQIVLSTVPDETDGDSGGIDRVNGTEAGKDGAVAYISSVGKVVFDPPGADGHVPAVGKNVIDPPLGGQLLPSSSGAPQVELSNRGAKDELSGQEDVPKDGGPQETVPLSNQRLDSQSQEFPVCQCDTVLWNNCSCTEPYGRMVYSDNDNADIIWWFDLGVSDVVTMVWFNKTDVSSSCSLTIGKVIVSNSDELLDTTTVYMRTDEKVVFAAVKNKCNRTTLYYAAVEPVPEYETIPSNRTLGDIEFPTEALGEKGYGMQKRKMWTFSYPENYTLELSITKLDLGQTSPVLNWNQLWNNFTQNDFLLVGLGEEIMQSNDHVLFGRMEGTKSIQINHPSAHVVFYGGYHEQFASGFKIQYQAKKVVIPPSTIAPPTTTPSPVTEGLPSTWVSLNGALNSNYSTLNASFLLAIATMATDYVNQTQLDVEPPAAINISDVILHGVATCRREFCDLDTCAAFLFSINKFTSDRKNWAFPSQVLDDMMRDTSLAHHWQIIDQGCEFCDESLSLNWYLIGGAALVAVLVAVLASFVAWKAKQRSSFENSKLVCEADMRQEELEKKRHSSGEVSMIGGVKGHRKIGLPSFDNNRHSTATMDSDDDEEAYDMGDFTEYDPDFGFEEYGLGSDLLQDSMRPNFYSNSAFEPDSPRAGSGGRYGALEQHTQQPRQRQARFETVTELDEDQEPHKESTPRQVPLQPNPVLKSSLKKKAGMPVVGGGPSPRATGLNKNEGLPKTSFRPEQKGSLKKITILEEEDEEKGVSSDSDDSDGAVQFQLTPMTQKTQRFTIQADVHSDDVGVTAF